MLRNYDNMDFEDVRHITEKYWENEVEMDYELKKFIYPFLVRYYAFNNNCSFVIENDNKVAAFLLACRKNEENNALNYFKDNVINLKQDNIIKAYEYLNYIEFNHKKVLKYMNENSLYLGLIASTIHHGGINLIDHLRLYAKENGINEIFLWTDETCNYKYYEILNFELIESYYVTLYNKKIKTFIYKLVI